MSRVTWFVAGAATGVYGLFRARRAARNLTPGGMAARAAAVGAGLRIFASEVAAGMAEREGELRDQLAISPVEPPVTATPMIDRAIERAVDPQNRTEESCMQPANDGHRDGHR